MLKIKILSFLVFFDTFDKWGCKYLGLCPISHAFNQSPDCMEKRNCLQTRETAVQTEISDFQYTYCILKPSAFSMLFLDILDILFLIFQILTWNSASSRFLLTVISVYFSCIFFLFPGILSAHSNIFPIIQNCSGSMKFLSDYNASLAVDGSTL